jgi:hypothetical protein
MYEEQVWYIDSKKLAFYTCIFFILKCFPLEKIISFGFQKTLRLPIVYYFVEQIIIIAKILNCVVFHIACGVKVNLACFKLAWVVLLKKWTYSHWSMAKPWTLIDRLVFNHGFKGSLGTVCTNLSVSLSNYIESNGLHFI